MLFILFSYIYSNFSIVINLIQKCRLPVPFDFWAKSISSSAWYTSWAHQDSSPLFFSSFYFPCPPPSLLSQFPCCLPRERGRETSPISQLADCLSHPGESRLWSQLPASASKVEDSRSLRQVTKPCQTVAAGVLPSDSKSRVAVGLGEHPAPRSTPALRPNAGTYSVLPSQKREFVKRSFSLVVVFELHHQTTWICAAALLTCDRHIKPEGKEQGLEDKPFLRSLLSSPVFMGWRCDFVKLCPKISPGTGTHSASLSVSSRFAIAASLWSQGERVAHIRIRQDCFRPWGL